jgi:hypothetical protein
MNAEELDANDAIRLFSQYLKVTGVAHIGPEKEGDPRLIGKRLGILNGSSWITLWSNYFCRMYLPGVHRINVGNEAIQVNFIEAHEAGLPTPPEANIRAFECYARDLVELARVDAVLITCSTMNRAYTRVREALSPLGVPVVQIDRPMMECAAMHGGRALIIATHGPTVRNTQALLRETAHEMGKEIHTSTVTVEEAWSYLARGDVLGHNEVLADTLRRQLLKAHFDIVVFAQLSMTIFLLSYPTPEVDFGLPILTSGQCGFEKVRDLFIQMDLANQ